MQKRIKTGLIIVASLLLTVGGAVSADYVGLFGSSSNIIVDFFEVRFRTVDADNGKLIINARAKCTQKWNDNACTNRDSQMTGIIAINIPVHYQLESTRLFEKNRTMIKSRDPDFHVFFVHNDYYTTNHTFQLEDILNNPGEEIVIKMSARIWENNES